jgi:hypothetical protein
MATRTRNNPGVRHRRWLGLAALAALVSVNVGLSSTQSGGNGPMSRSAVAAFLAGP